MTRIIFFGDSITELGTQSRGYVSLIEKEMRKKDPSIDIIGAGIGGNKVPDLLSRVDRDVLKKSPDIVFIYIGINDVWHSIDPGKGGTPKDIYESGLKEIIAKIQHAGGKVVLCTPGVIGEKWDGSNQLDERLDEYSAISRMVAQETGCRICDLRKTFIEYLREHNTGNRESGILTSDGVHLNDRGNLLVAETMLTMLGE